jgi:Tfp pilus assembly protein PilP
VSDNHARSLARVAAHGCFPSKENKHRQEDLASYIHDVARLGKDDIQMLRILRDSYKDVFRNDPNLRDPNQFTNHNESFKHAAEKLNIHPDDRLALGARLSGFGLAFESVPQEEHFFRPTRRGIYLLALLEAAESPIEKQN